MCGLALFCGGIFAVAGSFVFMYCIQLGFICYLFKLHCVGGCWDSNTGLLRLSNAQFYTVSVRTFVIPFYKGSGSGSDLEP